MYGSLSYVNNLPIYERFRRRCYYYCCCYYWKRNWVRLRANWNHSQPKQMRETEYNFESKQMRINWKSLRIKTNACKLKILLNQNNCAQTKNCSESKNKCAPGENCSEAKQNTYLLLLLLKREKYQIRKISLINSKLTWSSYLLLLLLELLLLTILTMRLTVEDRKPNKLKIW